MMLHSFLLFASVVVAQPIGPAPAALRIDGQLTEWPKTGEGDGGGAGTHQRRISKPGDSVWLAQSPLGLVAAGSIVDPPSQNGARHLEVRVSLLTRYVEMPPVGYYPGMTDPCPKPNEFLSVETHNGCLKWVATQNAFREKLRHLMQRRWKISLAPASGATTTTGLRVEETSAAPAWAALTKAQQTAAARLKPPAGILPLAAVGDRAFHRFELLIPWEALPPVSTLYLDRLHFDVSVIDGDRTVAGTLGWDGGSSDVEVVSVLFPAVRLRSSACESPLAGPQGETAYALITADRRLRPAFYFDTVIPCCGMITAPREEWTSPLLEPVDFFEYPLQTPALANGDWVCGPLLAWRRAGGGDSGSSVVSGGGAVLGVPEGFYRGSAAAGDGTSAAKSAQEARPQVRRMANGMWLVRDLQVEFYRKQTYTNCAGCPWRKLAFYSLSPQTGQLQTAFAIFGRMDTGIGDLDAVVSADWTVITEYRKQGLQWTAKRHCLSLAEGVYKPCAVGGEESPVETAPKNGLFPHLE